MFDFSGTGRRLASLALCACLIPLPTNAAIRLDLAPTQPAHQVAAFAPLVAELETWLDAHLPRPRRATAPAIRLVTPGDALRIGGLPGRGLGRARGLYDPGTATVFLVTPWDADDPQDVAVLLHELVHHRQAPHHFYCPEQQEEAAYRAQENWLGERGQSADVNWIAVTLAAGCTPRDIHPD